MGASCKITPDAPNGKESRLFKDLMSKFHNRDIAKSLWAFSNTKLFQSEFSDLAKDENGEVTAEALSEALNLDAYFSESEKDRNNALSLGLTNSNGRPVVFDDARVVMAKANEFNESAKRKIAVVEKTDDGRYRAVVKDNSAMAIAQVDRNEARRKLNTSLLKMLQRAGFNVEFAEDPGYDGAFDPLFAEQNAENIRTAIRVSTSKAGLDALPEEVSHLVIAGLKDHNLKQRLDNLMTPEVVRRILGDRYDKYRKRYERAKAPTEQLLKEEAEGQLLASMLKGENPLGNSNNRNIFTINRNEYTDEFRRIQERSNRLTEKEIQSYHRGRKKLTEVEQRNLGAVYERLLSGSMRSGNKFWADLKGKGNTFRLLHVNGTLFHDIFQINKNYLQNGELVDLHDNYDDCKCFLSDDGLCGFAIEPDGNLVSVFSLNPAKLNEKKGFLYAISDFAKEQGATHLDAYASKSQNLEEIYKKTLGFQTASRMDYNSEYDHDDIAKNHGNPDVVFMVDSREDVKEEQFDKDSYDAAQSYQLQNARKASSSRTNNSGIRNLLSRLWGHAKRLFGKMSEDDIDNAIAQARNVLNPIAESMVDESAEPMLSKEQIMAHERLYALSGEIDKLKQTAIDGLQVLEQRLAITRGTLQEDSRAPEVNRLITTIEENIEKEQYATACWNILSGMGDDLTEIAKEAKDLGRVYNNSTDLNVICTEADLVYRLGTALDGYSDYIAVLQDLPNLIKSGDIKMDPAMAKAITDYTDKFADTVRDLKKDYRSMRFNVLKQFISLFYGDMGQKPEGFTETDKIKWESVDQILNGAKEDIPFWDTNLFSAGESRNPLINVVHKIIVKQQAARNSRIRGFCARMQEAEAKLHRAGFNNDFVYQLDENGVPTGYYKGPVDYAKYDKDYKDFLEQLDRDHPDIDFFEKGKLIRDWENEHNEPVDTGKKDPTTGEMLVEIRPKREFYGTPDYNEGWSAAQQEYYDTLKDIKFEMDSYLPLHMRNTYQAPQVRKSISQIFDKGAKDAVKTFWSQKQREYDVVEDNTEYTNEEMVDVDFAGRQVKRVPIYYVNKMKDLSNLSTDATHSMFSYITMAVNYSEMGKIASAMRLLQNHVKEDYEVTQTSGGKPMIGKFSSRGRYWVKDYTKTGTDTAAGKALITYIDRQLFNDTKKKLGKKELMNGKAINLDVLSNLLLKATSVGRIGFNFLSGITNRTQGEAQMIGEATAGRYFNVKDLGWSEKEYAALLSGYVADFNSVDRHDKMYLLINTFNSSEEFFRDMMDRDFNKSAFKRVLGKGNVYFLNSLGEHALHTKGMLAVLKHEKVKVNGKTVSLYDAIKPVHDKNGWRLELSDDVEFVDKNKSFLSDFKDGKIKKSDSEKLFQNLAVYINIMNDYMHGGYSDAEKGNINQHALGRFILQFRQWMFGQYGKMFSKQHADIMTGTITEGSYNSLWRFLAGTITDMKNMSLKMALEKNKMTPQQWANAKVALAQVGVFQAMAILACLMKGWKDDDDWMKRLISYSVLRLKMETGAQVPFGIDFSNKGWPQVSMTFFTNFLTLVQSPMAATSSLEIITQLMDWTLISSGRFKGWPHALKAAWTLTPFYNIQKVTDMTQYKYMFNIFKGAK